MTGPATSNRSSTGVFTVLRELSTRLGDWIICNVYLSLKEWRVARRLE
jgi:hypothetical protein